MQACSGAYTHVHRGTHKSSTYCAQTVPGSCCWMHARPCAGQIQLVWSRPFESEQTAWEELVDGNAQGRKTQCLCKMTWSVANVQQQLADVRSRSTISCGRDRRTFICKMLAKPLLLRDGQQIPIGQQLPSRNDRVLKCPFALSSASSPGSYLHADRTLIVQACRQRSFACGDHRTSSIRKCTGCAHSRCWTARTEHGTCCNRRPHTIPT